MKLIIKKIAISILRIIAKFITSIVKILFKMPLTKEIIGDELSKATEACVHAIRKSTNAKVTNFKTLDKSLLPISMKNFEDLAFLFNCNYANRGIIAQDFDEGAYIFQTIRSRGGCNNLLEIGRFLGGSTFLIAVAKSNIATFTSVDFKVKTPDYADDEIIKQYLDLVDEENTELVISDSRIYEPENKLDFIFIDGDHSYEGVKADYNHYEKYLNNGCDVLFHDAVASRDYSTKHGQVYQLMLELGSNNKLEFIKDVGSIRHLKYIGS